MLIKPSVTQVLNSSEETRNQDFATTLTVPSNMPQSFYSVSRNAVIAHFGKLPIKHVPAC